MKKVYRLTPFYSRSACTVDPEYSFINENETKTQNHLDNSFKGPAELLKFECDKTQIYWRNVIFVLTCIIQYLDAVLLE